MVNAMPSADADLSYPVPEDDSERLQELYDHNILDTESEEPYDALTRGVARYFDVPTVLLSLVAEDRQWFKSTYGFEQDQTDRSCAFCNYTIVEESLVVSENAELDERFSNNPLVTGSPEIRFYAGYPLYGESDLPLGTLCLIDYETRNFTSDDVDALEDFAQQAETLLKLHTRSNKLEQKNKQLNRTRDKLQNTLDEKESLLKEMNHRIKNNLQTISSFLRLQSREVDQEEAESVLAESEQRVRSVMLIHKRLQRTNEQTTVDFKQYVNDLVSALLETHKSPNLELHYGSEIDVETLDVNYIVPLGLLITELVMNSIQHGFDDQTVGELEIQFHRDQSDYQLVISDNGSGLPDDFNIDEDGSFGMNLASGLAIDQLNGTFEIDHDNGTTVRMEFPVREDESW
jgi:two-component sensor histidine kinase